MDQIANAYRRSFTLRLICGFLLAALSLSLVGLLAKSSYFASGDLTVRDWVIQLESRALTYAMLLITSFGSTLVLTAFGIVFLAYFAFRRLWYESGLFLLAMAGQAALHLGFKALFGIERPEPLLDYVIGDTPSFPSGHAIASTVFYGFLALIIARHIRATGNRFIVYATATVIIFLIGFSRIYFGVHHPSDVLAGYLAGTIWLATIGNELKI